MKEVGVEYFSDLDTAWSWVVMVACFLTQFVIGGTNFTVGMVHTTLLEKYSGGQANTALVVALHTSISNLGAPLSSMIVDKFSVRAAVILSGLLYTVGYLCTAFAPSLFVTALTCGVIAGLGGAVGWTASMVAPGFHFRRYNNLAQGFSLAGVGAGIFGIPPIATWAQSQYGSFGFFVSLACVAIHSVVFGTIMWPSELEKYTQLKHRIDLQKQKNSCRFFMRRYTDLLKNITVICLCFSMFLFCSGLYMIFVYLPQYTMHKGTNEMQSSFLLSICGASSIFGRIVLGIIANTKLTQEIYLHCGCLTVLSLNAFLFPLHSGFYSGQIAFVILTGLTFGGPFVMLTPTNIRYLDVERMTAALSLELCMCGVGGMTGPVIAGTLVDSGGRMEHVFLLAGGFMALGAVLCILPAFIARQEGRAPKFQPDVNHEIEIMESMMPVDDYSMKGCEKQKV